jgi:YidC/Oxa1 family membrane protein insertase
MNLFTVFLTQPLANGLILFYKLLGSNMGLAIIGFSLCLRFLLDPLTRPYMKSMKKMREYQKDLDRLKLKYKDDKKKLMQAQADFYKSKGINPSAGCLPYLLQIIVLIALFNVFNSVLAGNGNINENFNKLLYDPLKFQAGEIVNTSFLYLNLTKPDVVKVALLPFALPGPLLIMAAIAQLISAKIATPFKKEEEKLAKKTETPTDDAMLQAQSSMIYMFPIMTILAGVSFPSGLALYWFLFSLFQAIQQYKSTGWGGATPWIRKLGLIKSADVEKGFGTNKKRN